MMRITVAFLLIFAVFTGSCALWHKKAVAAPPAVTAPPPTKPAAPETPELPPPPKLDTPAANQIPNAPAAAAQNPPEMPKPPAAQRPKQPRRQKKAVAAKPVEQPPAAPTAAGPAPPQLTQMISAADQAAYNRSIDAALGRVQANLARINGASLNASHHVNLERIQAFLREAQAARHTDLVTAKSFADRADLLAQDLVKSLGR